MAGDDAQRTSGDGVSARTVHRHGTLKGRWKALAFGMVWVVLGAFLARPALARVFAEAVPAPPSALDALLIFGGAFLVVIGLVLGITPHFLWLLRSFYKEDFAPGAICPVMVVCPSCREYNQRLRGACTKCGGNLERARAAGGTPSPQGESPTLE